MPDANGVKPSDPNQQPQRPKHMVLRLAVTCLVAWAALSLITSQGHPSTTKPVPTPSVVVSPSPSPSPSPGVTTNGNDPIKISLKCETGQVPAITYSPSQGITTSCATPATTFWDGVKAWAPLLLVLGGYIGFTIWRNRQATKGMQSGGIFGMLGLNKKFDPAIVPETRFTDVAGVDDAREELVTVVDMLNNPEVYAQLGAVLPKGVLLNGPPGTGKTLLARAVAGEAGIPFIPIAASEMIEGIVGLGASRVRDLFKKAKEYPKCIIFIDEIDAIGSKRSNLGGHGEHEQTLNQILTEMDGFDKNTSVLVIGATNRRELLDEAILRPGRFDRHVDFYAPDLKGRRDVISVHSANKKLAADVDLDKLARDTPGAVGADLAWILNDSAIIAGKQKKKFIEMKDVEEAVLRAQMGLARKSQLYDEKTKNIVAVHEAGHVIAALFAPKPMPVSKVSILGRGGAGGVTVFDVPDRKFWTKNELLSRMIAGYGGRAAERLILGEGEETQGAQSDLQNVRQLASEMVFTFGMSEKFIDIAFPLPQGMEQRGYSDETQNLLDQEIFDLSRQAMKAADEILTANRDKLVALAEALKRPESETIGQAEILKIVGLDLGDSGLQVA